MEADKVVGHAVKLSLKRAIRDAAAAATAIVAQARARVGTAGLLRTLEKAGIDAPSTLRAPGGYQVDESGVWLGETQVVNRPVVILGYMRHLQTGDVSVRLVWGTPQGNVTEGYVPRTCLSDMKALERKAPLVPLAVEPRALIAYFAAFEGENGRNLPMCGLTDRLGWHDRAFVLPGGEGGDIALQVRTDGEESAIVADVRGAGTLEGWREHFSTAPPLVQVAMLAAACTPLLEPCKAPGFVVDLAGLSSTGKSVALVAASMVWGPRNGRMMATWEGTKSGLMDRAGLLHSLPVILDDTKHAQNNPGLIAEVVYAITGGRERERSTKDGGMRRSKTWRTCLISTGEQRITMFSNDKGTRGRTLGFFESPFDSGEAAKQYVNTLGEHYGVAGPHVAGRWPMRSSSAVKTGDSTQSAPSFNRRPAQPPVGGTSPGIQRPLPSWRSLLPSQNRWELA